MTKKYLVPVAWMEKSAYEVEADSIEHAIASVIRAPEYPEDSRMVKDSFQFVLADMEEENELSEEKINKLKEEVAELGWEGFADKYISGG